jgi:hypothetical protein
MLPAKEFFGNSLDELRAHFGIVARPKTEIEREQPLSPKAWPKPSERRSRLVRVIQDCGIVPPKKEIE